MSTARAFVIAATGLAAEARIAARSADVRALAGFGNPKLLAALIEQSIEDGGRALISFGIAGGLAPDLQPGNVIIGNAVVADGVDHQADDGWTSRLAQRLPLAQLVKVAGVHQPVATPQHKAALNGDTGAAIADMESHIVARLAAKHSLPFAILRVVADDARCTLPPAALVGLRPDGTVDKGAVFKSIAGHPQQVPDLLRIAANTGRAMQSLLRCHRLAGAGLGFGDLG